MDLLTAIFNYYDTNKDKGIPYLRELKRLRSLDQITFINVIFPYPFVDKYNEYKNVYRDDEGYPFIVFPDNRKLYFPKNWDEFRVKIAFQLLEIEQDIESPHHYLPISPGSDITLDIGCAEANFSFFNYKNSREFHLFDTEEFKDVIHKTFNDNVIFHCGLVDASNSIDSINFNGKVDNIKLDVEGYEYQVLVGAARTIFKDKPNIQVCTYHMQNQFEEVYDLLKSFGYKNLKCSQGYMIFPHSGQAIPFFRKGLLYASYQ